MRYEKPELVTLPNAVEAVCMQDKSSEPAIDSGVSRRFTPNAYEADE
jgi:hypothetical protein